MVEYVPMIGRLASVAIALLLAAECRGGDWTNCFEIVDYGQIQHLRCTVEDLDKIDIAVDHWQTNNWEIICHGGGYYRFAEVEKGETITDATFYKDEYSLKSANFPFRFAMQWDGTAVGIHWVYHGWITLALDENAKLVILGSRMTFHDRPIVAGSSEEALPGADPDNPPTPPEPPGPTDDPVAVIDHWYVEDHGDWVSLARHCLGGVDMAENVKVVVPETINGKPVRGLDQDAFYGYSHITSLELPSGIEYIGYKAICGCRDLTRLVLPEGVTNVAYAGVSLPALGELTIPGSLKVIGEESFQYCDSLSNVTIRAGCSEIRQHAFLGCQGLEELHLPATVEKVDAGAFAGTYLRRLYVSWATEVDTSSEWPGAQIIRPDFPRIINQTCGLDPAAKRYLMRSIGAENFEDIEDLVIEVTDSNIPWGKWLENALICASLGLTPVSVTRHKEALEVEYAMPTIRVTKWDISTFELDGVVIPAEGSKIISEPRKYTIGMYAHAGYEGANKPMYRDYVTVDTSDYVKSNGVVRMTFEPTVLDHDYLYYAIIAGIQDQWFGE